MPKSMYDSGEAPSFGTKKPAKKAPVKKLPTKFKAPAKKKPAAKKAPKKSAPKKGNPHLNVITDYVSVVINQIEECKRELNKSTLKLLDIGGGKGWGKELYKRSDIDYYALDLKCSHKEDNITFIKGDITEKKLNLNEEFDIIFTKDTFEHILNPWDATENILNHLTNTGRFIFLAPFSWRYHASPYDTYRYSHTGAQYIFERLGKMKKIMSGYKKCGNKSGFWKNGKDHTIDGETFPKCLEVMYIGKKDENYVFSKECLDSDFSWDHKQ